MSRKNRSREDSRLANYGCLTEYWVRNSLGENPSLEKLCAKWRVGNITYSWIADFIEKPQPPTLEDIDNFIERRRADKYFFKQKSREIAEIRKQIEKLEKSLKAAQDRKPERP